MNKTLIYDWSRDITPQLSTLESVKGGFTPAKRGVVTLLDGERVFVKIATDERTAKWLKKEVKVYRALNAAGYAYIPELLAVADDESAMAIRYLEGASFDAKWDQDKLAAVMTAREALKAYANLFAGDADFGSHDSERRFEWATLLEEDNLMAINRRLLRLGVTIQFEPSHIRHFAAMHQGWNLRQDTLIHEDIRGDNFGYNPKLRSGKLIDWNWLCMGDEILDVTPLFVNMYATGFDPYQTYPDMYDARTVMYLIGFWLGSMLGGSDDPTGPEQELREVRAKSLAVCMKILAEKGDV